MNKRANKGNRINEEQLFQALETLELSHWLAELKALNETRVSEWKWEMMTAQWRQSVEEKMITHSSLRITRDCLRRMLFSLDRRSVNWKHLVRVWMNYNDCNRRNLNKQDWECSREAVVTQQAIQLLTLRLHLRWSLIQMHCNWSLCIDTVSIFKLLLYIPRCIFTSKLVPSMLNTTTHWQEKVDIQIWERQTKGRTVQHFLLLFSLNSINQFRDNALRTSICATSHAHPVL